MEKKKVPALSIVLYVLAGLLAFYTVWAMSHSFAYISDMMTENQLTFQGNEYDIINFIMTNCGQYFIFGVILFTLGWMLQKGPAYIIINRNAEMQEVSTQSKVDENSQGDSFDDWFEQKE